MSSNFYRNSSRRRSRSRSPVARNTNSYLYSNERRRSRDRSYDVTASNSNNNNNSRSVFTVIHIDTQDASSDYTHKLFQELNEPSCHEKPKLDEIEPSQELIVHNIGWNVADEDLEAELIRHGAAVELVRIARDSFTARSKGYAYARFLSVEHARIFHKEAEKGLYLFDRLVRFAYAINEYVPTEWKCSHVRFEFVLYYGNLLKCSFMNFRKRFVCKNCNIEKPLPPILVAVHVNDGSRDVGFLPCSVLLLRNLDALTTENAVYSSIESFKPTEVRLIQDSITRSSFGFAFVVFKNVDVATKAFQHFLKQPLLVDGKAAQVDFAVQKSFLAAYLNEILCKSNYFSPGQAEDSVGVKYWDGNAIYAVFKPEAKSGLDDLDAFYADLGDLVGDSVPTTEIEIAEISYASEPLATCGRNIQLPAVSFLEPKTDQDFIDYTRKACLLCERMFSTEADISQHIELSELHKNSMQEYLAAFNVEKKKQVEAATAVTTSERREVSKVQSASKMNRYRGDKAYKHIQKEQKEAGYLTAAEARLLYTSKQNPSKSLAEDEISAQLKTGLGAKMLEKMGWKDGDGLGKEGTGITAPIKAESYGKGVGLGTSRNEVDAARKMLNSRYNNRRK